MSDTKKFSILDDFPPISTKEWEAKIQQDLKGADYNKKLVWRTIEGFDLKPYYRSEDIADLPHQNILPGSFPFIRGSKAEGNDWEVRQDFTVSDIKSTNIKILECLNKGVTSIGIITLGSIKSLSDMETLLNNVVIECIPVNFICTSDAVSVAALYTELVNKRGVDKSAVKGSVSIDPLGSFLRSGNFITDEATDFQALKESIKTAGAELPGLKLITIDGLHLNNAGAGSVQELAYVLSMANEYVAKLTEAGLPAEKVLPHIQFTLGAGSNYFIEIAKIRAARLLWSKIAEAYIGEPGDLAKVFIHVNTTSWNKTVYDPYVNMLRVTTESMSAVIGGADSLTVSPFDEIKGTVNGFSERIARNTQIILKEEAYLDKIADPSAGSYYIETLTQSVANEAWKLFVKTEENGGFIKAFKAGIIQNAINQTQQSRLNRVATRREILLGTNQFPNADEVIKGQKQPADEKASENTLAKPINKCRAALEFEKLRTATDNAAKRPKAFMLTIGALAWRKARASFSWNFFACGGYEVVDNLGFETVEEGVKAALDAGADIVVLCSSDDEYAEFAPQAKALLNDKAQLVIAGAPECADELKAKGIEYFVHVKSNVLETLQHFNKVLGIK